MPMQDFVVTTSVVVRSTNAPSALSYIREAIEAKDAVRSFQRLEVRSIHPHLAELENIRELLAQDATPEAFKRIGALIDTYQFR